MQIVCKIRRFRSNINKPLSQRVHISHMMWDNIQLHYWHMLIYVIVLWDYFNKLLSVLCSTVHSHKFFPYIMKHSTYRSSPCAPLNTSSVPLFSSFTDWMSSISSSIPTSSYSFCINWRFILNNAESSPKNQEGKEFQHSCTETLQPSILLSIKVKVIPVTNP